MAPLFRGSTPPIAAAVCSVQYARHEYVSPEAPAIYRGEQGLKSTTLPARGEVEQCLVLGRDTLVTQPIIECVRLYSKKIAKMSLEADLLYLPR